MTDPRAGPVERWAGNALRMLAAALFVVGIGLCAGTLFATSVGLTEVITTAMGAGLTVPYLVIRSRDPTSTTLPFAGVVREYRHG